MAAVEAQALRRGNPLIQWLAFAIQALIAVAFELGDDIGRGFFSQHGTIQGIQNARSVVSFEAAHGFWIEPAWQTFFLQTRHFFAWTITWLDVANVMNAIYVGCHVGVTLAVAVWLYFYRHRYFAVFRNVIMLCNALALIVYENFPVAPPRLTTDIDFDGHPFTFQDTVFGALSAGGKLVGNSVGYNEFSAMPSVHMAWAVVVGAAVVLLARPLIVRVLGALYPVLMLVAVVVTGNHFLLDAIGAVAVVLVAAAIAGSLAWWATTRRVPRLVRLAVIGEG
jgi:hypothetical protein